jgi:acyl carrier protein
VVDERMERLKRVLIEGLHLQPLTPAELDPDEPLFGGRLGLDSVDALELVMEVECHFGVQRRPPARVAGCPYGAATHTSLRPRRRR